MKKILVVDDQKEIRELIAVTLRSTRYQIIEASSGEAAIEATRQSSPDLIILDVMMPGGIDGLQTCKKLKAIPGAVNAPIIMLTARGQDDDIEEGLAAGAHAYLVKPFSPLELLDKVEEILKNGY